MGLHVVFPVPSAADCGADRHELLDPCGSAQGSVSDGDGISIFAARNLRYLKVGVKNL